MADTTYLTNAVEEFVRARLAETFGQKFESRRLPLLTGGTHQFDAVSEYFTVVAGIKASSGRTSGGKLPVGKIKSAIAELYYLSLVSAHRRILVLTDPEFHEILTKRLHRALAPGLELMLIELPADIQAKVDLVQSQASREVSPIK